MPWCTRNGVRLYYEVTGEGPDLVMLHANPCDHRMWMYQAARLSRRFRVIAPDMRGYGRSDKPEERYGFDQLVADAFAICGQEGVTSAIVAGASMGSKIAFGMAIERPELCRALVQIGGSAFRGASYDGRIEGYLGPDLAAYRAQHLAELFAPGFAETARGRYLCNVILDDSQALSGRALAALFRSFDGVDLANRVVAIAAPVLIVNGAHDSSLAGGRRTASLIAGARHAIIEKAGHLCILEEPEAFDAIIVAFLRENRLFPPLSG
jgi:pimeloyl-ACP methyl ester carboxylesterase